MAKDEIKNLTPEQSQQPPQPPQPENVMHPLLYYVAPQPQPQPEHIMHPYYLQFQLPSQASPEMKDEVFQIQIDYLRKRALAESEMYAAILKLYKDK
jgi:hypothetical protein